MGVSFNEGTDLPHIGGKCGRVEDRFPVLTSFLSDRQRHDRVQYARDILGTYHTDKNLVNMIVVVDKRWCSAMMLQLDVKVLH